MKAITLSLLLLTGCALFQSTSTEEQKVRDIRNLSYAAASIGTSIAITEHPEWKPKFQKACERLEQLLISRTITGELLRQVIADLPVKELKSEKARIAIAGATLLYDSMVGTAVNVEDAAYVVAAARGIRDGIKIGLDSPPR